MTRRRGVPVTKASQEELQARLSALIEEHRDLDVAIEAMLSMGSSDQLQMQRMKKRKLALRDEIAHVQDQMVPDIIA